MLVAAELRASAASLRSSAGSTRSLIDATSAHHHTLSSSGFAGSAPELGLERLLLLGRDMNDPAERMDAVAEVLEQAAGAQAALDRAMEALTSHAAAGAMANAVMPGAAAAHQAAVAAIALQIQLLDQACAAAVTAAAGEYVASREANLDRLVFHPGESLEDISAKHLASAPAGVREAVTSADGLILEAGTGEYGSGFTVLVGPPGSPPGSGWAVAPQNITTIVAGVSTGDAEKLPQAIARAQEVAAATGGAVVVWQGYNPPTSVVTGAEAASARAGADDLAAFQMALDERFPDARKVVIGHSYGSVVVTRAAMDHGLFADELILAGSPGVPAHSADQLTLIGENTRVTVADSPTDPIKALRTPIVAAHGFNPAGPAFGAEHVHGIRGGHTDYFSDPAFLREVAAAGGRRR